MKLLLLLIITFVPSFGSTFAQTGCDRVFGCGAGVPRGGGGSSGGVRTGCDPRFGCPTGVPNGGIGCDPRFGCGAGVPNGGFGCDPRFGCPTGTGGQGSFVSSRGAIYTPTSNGGYYNNATGEYIYPTYLGGNLIAYNGSNGSRYSPTSDGSFLSRNGERLPIGRGQVTPHAGSRPTPSSPVPAVTSFNVGDLVQVRVATYLQNGLEVTNLVVYPGTTYIIDDISTDWILLRTMNGDLLRGWLRMGNLMRPVNSPGL